MDMAAGCCISSGGRLHQHLGTVFHGLNRVVSNPLSQAVVGGAEGETTVLGSGWYSLQVKVRSQASAC